MQHPNTRYARRALAALSLVTVSFLAPQLIAAPAFNPTVKVLGTYESGIYEAGGAEIVAHDPLTQRLYVVNAQAASVDVLSIVDPQLPVKVGSVSLLPFGGVANSVAVHGGLVAVAVEASPTRTDAGKVVFFDQNLQALNSVSVGAVPDMVTYTHNGRYVLVANEAEPEGYLTGQVDPEGSVSIIDLGNGVANATVATAGFASFNSMADQLRAAGIRIFGPGSSVAQDLEPEYIAVSPDDTTAWVTLQENNALAKIDIASATVTELIALGLKDHNTPGNGLDPSDRDNAIRIANWPLKGMYQPDAITAFTSGSDVYLLLANEGDAREWDGLVEETTVGATTTILDTNTFPNASTLKSSSRLGRLRISSKTGDTDGDGDFDELHTFGARSFSVRNASGALVYDSGDAFEQITAITPGVIFNASHDNNTFDARSRSKGPEPEGIATGSAFGRQWAFVALERVGGFMVYDLTVPTAPAFTLYINNRNFTGKFGFGRGRDLGPEGIIFISAENSPIGQPLIVVGNEISGTTTLFQFKSH